MRAYAEAAMLHAKDRHAKQLAWDPSDILIIDEILDREREFGDSSHYQSLALCYGCWIGELAIQLAATRQFDGRWIGLQESHPPRVVVAGYPFSPIDAVLHRLAHVTPSIQQLWQDLLVWIEQYETVTADAAAKNLLAWNELASDSRFAISEWQHLTMPDRETARTGIDPWLAELPPEESRLLLLAAGGGTQSLLHAVAGFNVTVVDISPRMLEIDRQLAHRFGLPIETECLSIEDLTVFQSAYFDAVVQPVSSCYVPDVSKVYRQVARLLRPGGLYVVQHKQPASLQASGSDVDGYRLRHRAFQGQSVWRNDSSTSNISDNAHLEPGSIEFIHPLESLLGELCRSGFVIEDVIEPPRADAWAPHESPNHRACYLPPYLKIKARRRDTSLGEL